MLPSWVPILMVVVAAPMSLRSAQHAWTGAFQPNLVTWTLWAAAPLIAAAAAISAGAGTAALPIVAAGVGPALVVVAALAAASRGNGALWQTRRSDHVCALIAAAAVIGWQATGDPLVAAVLAVAADAVAAVPSITKAWRHPHTETPWGYAAGVVTGTTALLTLTVWDPVNWLFPAYLVAVCGLLVVLAASPGRRPGTDTGDS